MTPWLIETRVVFEYWNIFSINPIADWLIETRVVFECSQKIMYVKDANEINRNKSCIWIWLYSDLFYFV